VKGVLSAIGRFFAILFAVLIAITGVSVLLDIIPIWSGPGEAGASTYLALIVRSLRNSWFVVGIGAMLAWLFSLLRHPAHRSLARLLVFVIATVTFIAGGVAVGFLNTLVTAEQPSFVIRPGGFYDTGDGFVYFEDREGLSYRNGVRLQDTAPPRMTPIRSARQNPPAARLTIPATGEQLSLSQFESVYWTETEPPPEFAGFFSAAAEVSRTWIAGAAPRDLSYLSLGAVTILLFSMAWVIVRLTKWPLLNAVLAVLLAWGVVELLAVDLSGFAQEILGDTIPGQLYAFGPHAVLAVVTLILVIIGLFQPPFREWQRTVAGG
jgi:hypothetical protein